MTAIKRSQALRFMHWRQKGRSAAGKCSFSHLRIGEAHLSPLTPGWQKILESLYKKKFYFNNVEKFALLNYSLWKELPCSDQFQLMFDKI